MLSILGYRGFASIVAVSLIFILLSVSASSADLYSYYSSAESSALEIQAASLRRLEAELFVDSAIKHSLENSALTDYSSIKSSANSSIIQALNYFDFSDSGLCTDSKTNSTNFPFGTLSLEELNSVSKVVVLKNSGVLVVSYHITGGLSASEFPCAVIRSGDFSFLFEMPVGYSVIAVVAE